LRRELLPAHMAPADLGIAALLINFGHTSSLPLGSLG
jgi:hypothetical protein